MASLTFDPATAGEGAPTLPAVSFITVSGQVTLTSVPYTSEAAASFSASPVSGTSITQSAASTGNPPGLQNPSVGLKIAIGVGLGLGIPLPLLGLVIWYWVLGRGQPSSRRSVRSLLQRSIYEKDGTERLEKDGRELRSTRYEKDGIERLEKDGKEIRASKLGRSRREGERQ